MSDLPFWLKCILVALATGITDIFWTLYITNAASGNKLKASIHSAFIIIVGGFTVVQYVNDHTLLLPAAIGAFLGTYFPLALGKKNEFSK